MSSNEKRWVILLVAVLIIAVVLIVVLVMPKGNNEGEPTQQNEATNESLYTEELEGGSKLNTSEAFNGTKTYGDLEFTNIQFSSTNGVSTLLADVTNKGTTTHEVEPVKVTIIGENDEVIAELDALINKVEPGQTVDFNAIATADITEAKDFRIEANNETNTNNTVNTTNTNEVAE